MTKKIIVKHGDKDILNTKGEEMDVKNWIGFFKTISVTRFDGEVLIRVTDNDEEYDRSKILIPTQMTA
ncbi:hypothetical protein [Bacillus sp. FJAT-28004]|uniref:hypothetical protein n=1 Tax=Bacillus sp. FJAT-28004 TaxID=1679165 RepID=UPI0006B4A9A6|nr:hypothetical protein [Bacillus sp. FJAT-28004]